MAIKNTKIDQQIPPHSKENLQSITNLCDYKCYKCNSRITASKLRMQLISV